MTGILGSGLAAHRDFCSLVVTLTWHAGKGGRRELHLYKLVPIFQGLSNALLGLFDCLCVIFWEAAGGNRLLPGLITDELGQPNATCVSGSAISRLQQAPHCHYLASTVACSLLALHLTPNFGDLGLLYRLPRPTASALPGLS